MLKHSCYVVFVSLLLSSSVQSDAFGTQADDTDLVQVRLESDAGAQLLSEAQFEDVSTVDTNYAVDSWAEDLEDVRRRRAAPDSSKPTPAPTEKTSTPKCHIIQWLADHDPDGTAMAKSLEDLAQNKEAMNDPKYVVFGGIDQFPTQRKKSERVNSLNPAYGKNAVEFHEFSQYIEKYTLNGEVKLGVSKENEPGTNFTNYYALKTFYSWAFLECYRNLQPSDTEPNPEIVITIHSRPSSALDPDVEGSFVMRDYHRHKLLHKAIIDGMKYQHPEIDKVTLISFDGMLTQRVQTLQLYSDIAEYILMAETNHPTHGWDYKRFSVTDDAMAMARSIVDSFVAAPPQYTPKALSYVRTTHFSKFLTAWRQLGQVMLTQLDVSPSRIVFMQQARDSTPDLPNMKPEHVDVRSLLRNMKTACDNSTSKPRNERCTGRFMKVLDVTIEAYRSMMARGYFRKNRNDLVESLSGVGFAFPNKFARDRKMNYEHLFHWLGSALGEADFDPNNIYGWMGLVNRFLCARPLTFTITDGVPGSSVWAGLDPLGNKATGKNLDPEPTLEVPLAEELGIETRSR